MFEELKGVDVELGLSYCMDDEDFYAEVLQEYINSNKLDELEQLFSAQDWSNYQIRIHAVKSTSLNIGARDLSAKAFELEMACKEGRSADILAGHASCMADYRAMLACVQAAVDNYEG